MKIRNVQRFTIPITGSRESLNFDGGTTVTTLIDALRELPANGRVSLDYGEIFVTYVHPEIEIQGE